MLQLGDFKLPTLGDAVLGTEAIMGNIVEGIIEGVTGDKVELTPGAGVDNTRVEGARGKGEVKFEQKMASHSEVERLRRELEKELTNVKGEVAKLKIRRQTDRQLAPGVRPIGTAPLAQPNAAGGMNPMMMLLLTRGNSQIRNDPLMLMMMMQQMGTSVGQVNGQSLQLDPMAFATMQMFADALAQPAAPAVRNVNAPPATAGT